MISAAQIRAARGFLGWSQAYLAQKAGLSKSVLVNVEGRLNTPRESTILSIKQALESGGVEFNPTNGGVHMRQQNVYVLSDSDGYVRFKQIVLETATAEGGEVLSSGVDERQFTRWYSPEHDKAYMDGMKRLKNVRGKFLVREGDYNFIASDYAEYRWISKQDFKSVPFYVVGGKLAIMLLEMEPMIILIDIPAVAAAYRIHFHAMWEQAKIPPLRTTNTDTSQ
ncbi:MAG: XRE family transcriptional regulator [Alphaproteobacteria bacterium]|nr:MAG: XRE family transcriptional regulator [Alphaproteobacteria bacterium]